MFHYCSNMGGTLPLSRMVRKRGSHDLSTADLGLLGIVSEPDSMRKICDASGETVLRFVSTSRLYASGRLLKANNETLFVTREHLAEEVAKIAHVAEKFGALLAVDAEVDGIDRRGSTGVHGHFEWTFFCAASRYFGSWEEETSARGLQGKGELKLSCRPQQPAAHRGRAATRGVPT